MKVKKLILVAAIAATMAGCSSLGNKNADLEPVSKEAIKYTQDFGKVEVTFTDKGDWESLKSSATAAVPLTDEGALEQAMNVATMRAKRNIVEFIKTDLQSKKTTEIMTNALGKDVVADDAKTKERAGHITTKIQENIAVEASGIVSGVYILERKVTNDQKMVVVTLQVDKRSMRAARQIGVAIGS
jgi:hypothetical protein